MHRSFRTTLLISLATLLSLPLAGCGGSNAKKSGGPQVSHSLRFVLFGGVDSYSAPFGLTADGKRALGSRTTFLTSEQPIHYLYTPLIWDEPSNAVTDIPLNGVSVYATAFTDDGSVIGGSQDWAGGYAGLPVLVRPNGERTLLPMPSGANQGRVVDLSADGKTALCMDTTPQYPAFPKPYIVRGSTATHLPLPEDATITEVFAISADGKVAVGVIDDQAAVWTNGGPPQIIAETGSVATGVSRNGTVVVGTRGADMASKRPFRWTAASGTEALPLSPGQSILGEGVDISADGNTVLISSRASWSDDTVPQLWRIGKGTKTLDQLFVEAGGTAEGFDGRYPRALSADGSTVLGIGRQFPNRGAWKLTLP